jgi:hypothetical protein
MAAEPVQRLHGQLRGVIQPLLGDPGVYQRMGDLRPEQALAELVGSLGRLIQRPLVAARLPQAAVRLADPVQRLGAPRTSSASRRICTISGDGRKDCARSPQPRTDVMREPGYYRRVRPLIRLRQCQRRLRSSARPVRALPEDAGTAPAGIAVGNWYVCATRPWRRRQSRERRCSEAGPTGNLEPIRRLLRRVSTQNARQASDRAERRFLTQGTICALNPDGSTDRPSRRD